MKSRFKGTFRRDRTIVSGFRELVRAPIICRLHIAISHVIMLYILRLWVMNAEVLPSLWIPMEGDVRGKRNVMQTPGTLTCSCMGTQYREILDGCQIIMDYRKVIEKWIGLSRKNEALRKRWRMMGNAVLADRPYTLYIITRWLSCNLLCNPFMHIPLLRIHDIIEHLTLISRG